MFAFFQVPRVFQESCSQIAYKSVKKLQLEQVISSNISSYRAEFQKGLCTVEFKCQQHKFGGR